MMTFFAKMRLRIARSGKSYTQCCREMGSAGGKKAAANKRAARAEREKFHMEQQRQVAMGLKDADEVFSDQDLKNIARESGHRRIE